MIVTLVESLGPREDFVDFLRIACTLKYDLVKERELFTKIKRNIETPLSAERFVHELEELASGYVAMLTPDHQNWNSYPGSIRRALRTLARFDVMQIRYMMLAVAREFRPVEAARAFQLFVSWIVRFFIAGADRIGRLDKRYSTLSHAIYTKNDISTAAKLAEEMRPELADNDLFRENFAKAHVSQIKLAHYYLDALERKLTDSEDAGLVPDDDNTKVNLEHIIPINPGNEWKHISPEEAEGLYNRLGNLALLNSRKNSTLGNVGFSKKREAFESSPFLLTQKAAAAAKWDAEEINKRQAFMADLAVKTWPI